MRRALAALICVASAGFAPGAALAAPGQLDTSFDGDGFTRVQLAGRDVEVRAAVRQLNGANAGKIVLLAQVRPRDANRRYLLVRLNPDGSVDRTFSNGSGAVVQGFSEEFGLEAHALLRLASDRLIVAGEYDLLDAASGDTRLAFARHAANGALDREYADDGRTLINLNEPRRSRSSPDERVVAMVRTSDGGLVAGAVVDRGGPDRFTLIRLDRDGNQNHAFGGDGVTEVRFEGRRNDHIAALGTHQGKIVAVGTSARGSESDLAVARFHSTGRLDRSFAGDGAVRLGFRTGLGHDARVDGRAISAYPDGKIVVAGTSHGDVITSSSPEGRVPDGELVVARLDARGRLDDGFDFDGALRLNPTLADDEVSDILLDGRRILLGGRAGSSLLVASVGADGSPDLPFGRRPDDPEGTGFLTDNFTTPTSLITSQAIDTLLPGPGRTFYTVAHEPSFPHQIFVARYGL